MASHKFSMEKILGWRFDLEDEARLQLSNLQDKWNRENLQLQSLIQENIKVKNDNLKNTQIQTLRYNDYYKMVIDEKIVQQKNQMDSTQAQINKAQEQLLDAHKNRRAMEKLKEKELTAAEETMKRLEQMQLDEFATMNYKQRAL
ncbi:flagellar export protein FliJ [Jeotgalibaca ciconiae]|uniref:Flagellar FliJ protein n=1 Tax=Jeotgalibaca ciconiae TaxID=2496265 RepID=A0A3S9HA85_9LACT|nr:flagellar export protein FliJ [Jeotgalibaca ciconiae]AZP04275.1 flagellar export protein FliJ [Jeotgalibaca ciconiae]HJB23437.1 flagellar export protein FliJ [Candidatus Jeotgalibaca pullicola]